MKVYDAIVVGGGPAGLSCAIELSKKNNILLIEQNKIGKTAKSWCTWKSVLKKHRLVSCQNSKTNSFYLKSKNKKFHAKSSLVSVDEEKLLLTLKKRINRKNTTIKENCSYQNYSYGLNFIEVKTSLGKYRAKCLIDCSGAFSKIVKKNKLNKDQVYERCVAKNYLGKIKYPQEILLWDLVESGLGEKWFWKTPLNKNHFVLGSFNLSKNKGNLSLLRENLNKKEKSLHLNKDKKLKYSAGIIPLRLNKTLCMNRIMFVGDASGGSSFGFGLHLALKSGKIVAKYFNKAKKRDDFSKDFLLNYEKGYRDQVGDQYYLNQLIIDFVITGDKHNVKSLFKAFNHMSNKERDDFFKSRLNPKDFNKYLTYISKEISIYDVLKFIAKENPKNLLEDLYHIVSMARKR